MRVPGDALCVGEGRRPNLRVLGEVAGGVAGGRCAGETGFSSDAGESAEAAAGESGAADRAAEFGNAATVFDEGHDGFGASYGAAGMSMDRVKIPDWLPVYVMARKR